MQVPEQVAMGEMAVARRRRNVHGGVANLASDLVHGVGLAVAHDLALPRHW